MIERGKESVFLTEGMNRREERLSQRNRETERRRDR